MSNTVAVQNPTTTRCLRGLQSAPGIGLPFVVDLGLGDRLGRQDGDALLPAPHLTVHLLPRAEPGDPGRPTAGLQRNQDLVAGG
jgi:hypothetical protein